MKKSVAIYGSNGYLGGETIRTCIAAGSQVMKLPRISSDIPEMEKLKGSVFIDCGFPRNYFKQSVEKQYMLELVSRCELAKEFNAEYVYLGSYSATLDSKSIYGRVKSEAQNIVQSYGFISPRFGLIVDPILPGGRYKELLNIIDCLPVVPIPSNKWFPIKLTSIEAYRGWLKSYLEEGEVVEPAYTSSTLGELIDSLTGDRYKIEVNSQITGLLISIIQKMPLKNLDGIKSIASEVPKIDFD